jgi:hypothetical protein
MDRLRRIVPLCAGDATGPALIGLPAGPSSAVRRNLCTVCRRNGARNIRVTLGGIEILGRGMKQQKPN